MLKQWILLLVTSLILSACFKENDKNSGLSLPPINTNLSTESPVGIWLWHIDIEASETFQDETITRENQDQYFIRQLIIIKPGSEVGEIQLKGNCLHNFLPTNNRRIGLNNSNGYGMNDFTLLSVLSMYDPNFSYQYSNISNTDLPDNWQVSNSHLIPVNDLQPPSNEIGIIKDPLVPLPYISQDSTNKSGRKSGELFLDNNLALSGQLNYQATNFHHDETNYHRKMSIRGVKISDATLLSEASEVELKAQLKQEEIILDSGSSLSCLRTVIWQSELNTIEDDIENKSFHRHELATILISGVNDLHIEHDLLSFKQTATYGTLFSSRYINLCLDRDDFCQSALQFKQQINNHNQGFNFSSDITTQDGSEYQSEVSLIIKP